jgi:hypothetical protein
VTWPACLRPVADRDVNKTVRWYERQSTGLGRLFLARILTPLDLVERTPDRFAVLFADVRATKVPRFPYWIYYRIRPTHLDLVAVLHGRRNPVVVRSLI